MRKLGIESGRALSISDWCNMVSAMGRPAWLEDVLAADDAFMAEHRAEKRRSATSDDEELIYKTHDDSALATAFEPAETEIFSAAQGDVIVEIIVEERKRERAEREQALRPLRT